MPHDDPAVGKIITAEWGQTLSTFDTFIPALTADTTDPNLGASGEIVGAFHRTGHMIIGWIRWFFSGAGVDPGSGPYRLSVPFDADTSIMETTTGSSAASFAVAFGRIHDKSTGANTTSVTCQFNTANSMRLHVPGQNAVVTDSSPFIWASGDRGIVQFQYIADGSLLP